jgi:hypothetical protein
MWPSAIAEPPKTAGIRISSANSRKNSHIRKNGRASPHRRGRDTSMLLPVGFYTTKTNKLAQYHDTFGGFISCELNPQFAHRTYDIVRPLV